MKTDDAYRGMQTILELYEYGKNYPNGAIKIGQYYYNIAAITNAINDIQMRALVGGETKADNLLMAILAGLIVPG